MISRTSLVILAQLTKVPPERQVGRNNPMTWDVRNERIISERVAH